MKCEISAYGCLLVQRGKPITEPRKMIRAAVVAPAHLKHDKLSNEGASHQKSTAEAAVHEKGCPKPLQATVGTV